MRLRCLHEAGQIRRLMLTIGIKDGGVGPASRVREFETGQDGGTFAAIGGLRDDVEVLLAGGLVANGGGAAIRLAVHHDHHGPPDL